MDKPKTTPKDFFLWAGAMVAFYWSVIAFILLTFDYINYAFPNALNYYQIDPYQSGISSKMASIIVLLPLYMFLMRLIRADISRDSSRKEIWVRRWALILTLFIAGIAIAGDLIALLTSFLNGEELTTAFVLKVLVIFLIATGVFMHFIADLKGYWEMFPLRKRAVGIGVVILALVTIVAGFFIVGTPQQARLARFDAQKVSDLQNIQYQVVNYWQAKQNLPTTLADISDPISGYSVPNDPQTSTVYEYAITGALAFQLCASFNVDTQTSSVSGRKMVSPVALGALDNWQHGVGRTCFTRTIDPQLYQPLNK